MKRSRSDKPTVQFYIHNPKDNHYASFDVHTYGSNAEDAFYVLKLHRPGLKHISLYTLYIQREDECIYSHALSDCDPCATRVLMDRKYLVYETYTLAQDTEDAGVTYALYINIQESAHVRADMTLKWLPQHVKRLKNSTLQFHPWDVDVTAYGLKLDTRTVPQRTPLWFKSRGQVTGTKAYMLLGYWVPTKQEDPNWTLDGEKTFSEFQKRNMRFGVESEDKALLLYAHHFPHVEIELVGLCKAPPPLPGTWGASPDGILHDTSHTWEDIPEKIRSHWNKEEWEHRASHGVLEIKCTAQKNGMCMEPYYFPQVYMEMICTQTLWADVVRYTAHGNARVYRVYRHKPTEDTLVSLIKYALSKVDTLQDVVFSEASFIKMRDHFERVALTMPHVELELTGVYKELRSQFEQYQKALENEKDTKRLKVSNASSLKDELDAIRDGHNKLYALFNDPPAFKATIHKQMELYHKMCK